jgi:hypothetical protein
MAEFNSYANPKVETKRFKIYADVGSSTTPEWELQGRGVESWTVEENSDVEKTTDVLGYVDMERGVAQPTQSGVAIKLRKGSKFGEMLFDAWFKHDTSKLDAIKMLQKFEFADGEAENTCLARLEEDVMIAINNFTGEAGGYLGFEVDIHYANKTTLGTMPKVDGETITFTPDSAA